MPEEARGLRGGVRRRLDTAEDELLRTDAQSIAVFQLGRLLDPMAVQLHAVATVEIVEDRAIAIEDDARVMP